MAEEEVGETPAAVEGAAAPAERAAADAAGATPAKRRKEIISIQNLSFRMQKI